MFAVAFAFVESAVVTYLRALYYPDGFSFPLRMMGSDHVLVELTREFATMVMLVCVAWLAGNTRWKRFGYFLVAFGVWDIFYYVWLKVILNWPASIFDWDILFLIPVPWIGPVIAPLLVSVIMIVAGFFIIRREDHVGNFRPPMAAWLVSGLATALILYTFIRDTGATLYSQPPLPYLFIVFYPALLLYAVALLMAFRKSP